VTAGWGGDVVKRDGAAAISGGGDILSWRVSYLFVARVAWTNYIVNGVLFLVASVTAAFSRHGIGMA